MAELNEQTQNTLDDLANNEASLDSYVATIEELAGKSNLTATEQEKLKLAVEGYNQITGDSVKVTDAASGKLSESTDKLVENAEAWKENARAQAYQEMAIEYIREQAEAELVLQQAQEKRSEAQDKVNQLQRQYNREQEEYGHAMADTTAKLTDARAELRETEEAVDSAKTTYDSATNSVDALTEAQVLNSEAGKAMADALKGFGSGFTDSLDAIGVNLDNFTVALADAGVSTEQLKEVGSDNIIKLAATFGGNVDMMTWAIKNYNNTPMVDKNGNVTVDDEELVDAQGNVVVWNGTELVYKETNASVEDGSLVDAQGNLYEWNGSTLKRKSGSANITGNLSSMLDERSAWNNGYLKSFSAAARITATVTSMFSGWGNASGGIRKHADGFIATGPTMIGPRDVMGEAGAEAFTSVGGSDYIIPLTNRRYSQPFVDLLSDGVASRLAHTDRPSFSSVTNNVTTNNYTLYINTEKGNVNSRIAEAVSAVFDAYFTTVEQGVI